MCSHSSSSSLPSLILPLIGISIVERLRDRGYDNIVCFDDSYFSGSIGSVYSLLILHAFYLFSICYPKSAQLPFLFSICYPKSAQLPFST